MRSRTFFLIGLAALAVSSSGSMQPANAAKATAGVACPPGQYVYHPHNWRQRCAHIAQAGPRTVVRDHRGQSGQSPTGNQSATNPIVRDHRAGGGPMRGGGGGHR